MIKDRQRIYKKIEISTKYEIQIWSKTAKEFTKILNSDQIQNIYQPRLPNRCRIDKRTIHRTNTGQM